MKQRGLRQSTRRGRVAALRSWGNWLVETGRSAVNPWAKVKTPVNEELRQPCPSDAQVRLLFDACDHMRNRRRGKMYKAVLALTALAGLRLCELLAVRVEDLCLTGDKRHIVIPCGKGGYRGSVPLNSLACTILADWLAVRPKTDCPYLIFLGGKLRGDRQCTDTAIYGLFSVLCSIADLESEDIGPHALRRFGATALAQQQGSSIADSQKYLRHSSPQTTLRYLKRNSDLSALVEGILPPRTPLQVSIVPPPPPASAPRYIGRDAVPTGTKRPAWRRSA